MNKWEYRNELTDDYRMTDHELNKLGHAGWELVNFFQTQAGGFVYIFKRELQGINP